MAQHDAGMGAAYTSPRRRRPVTLVWARQFDRVDDAYRYEKQIQAWGRAKREALIDGRLDALPGLARGRCRRPLAPDTEQEGSV